MHILGVMINFKIKLIFLALSILGSLTAEAKINYLNNTEIGQTTTGGNSESLLINVTQKSTFVHNENKKLILNGSYLYGQYSGYISIRRWNIGTRFAYKVFKNFDSFIAQNISGDKSRGFQERFDSDLGIKHYLKKSNVKEVHDNIYIELGPRYSKENRTSRDADFNDTSFIARLYIAIEKQITKTFYLNFNLESLGNLEKPGRYRSVFKASANSTINNYLTLKIKYTALYDDFMSSENLDELDYVYTTSIAASF